MSASATHTKTPLAAAGAAAGAAGGAAAPPTLRNFFGQRPPSELISLNLAEYFPEAKQRELEQTVRNLVRYSVQYLRRLPVLLASLQRRALVASTRALLASDPKRAPASRTIGEMMVSNIAAIDEAAATLKPPPLDASIALLRASRRVLVNFGDAHHRHLRIELLSVDLDDDDDVVGGYLDDSALDAILETEVLPNWLQGARIGAGSFGTVYLGMSPLTGELMAVKQVSLPDAANHSLLQIEALQHEMSLLKQLNHENIVRYLGLATNSHYLNIFLEYVPGGLVLSMLLLYGPFEEPLIRNFVRQVLIGLSYLHGEDIIHRDIKGANILIDIKGTVKISDFGILKKLSRYELAEGHAAPAAPPAGGDEDRTSRRASLQGLVYWMAPEVVKQTAYTKKADIWLVGCLIVEMFTGKHPFPDFSQMQAIFKIGTHVAPQIPEWCTREAQDFLRRSFELDYRNRPDAVDMLAEPFLNTLIMSKGT